MPSEKQTAADPKSAAVLLNQYLPSERGRISHGMYFHAYTSSASANKTEDVRMLCV